MFFFFLWFFVVVCLFLLNRLPATALQENFPSLLGVLKESVQLNLAPPGYFLLLRYRVPSHSALPHFFFFSRSMYVFISASILILKLIVSQQHAE